MQWFRTHITQSLLTLALLWGICFQLSSAANQDLREAVMQQWLQWQLNSYGEDLKAELADLGYDDEQILNVIRDASVPDEDQKKEDSESGEQEVFRVLIGQWNAWNGQNQGMGKTIIPDQHKPTAVQNSDAIFAGLRSSEPAASARPCINTEIQKNQTLPASHILSPHKSGTAIGAP